jgi:hypothetical protein
VPTSLAWAEPFKQPSWKQNMKVGVEVGFGAPYGWLINKQEDTQGRKLPKIELGPNWRFGVVWGYGFPIFDNALAIGPDTGLFIETKRKIDFAFPCGVNMTVEEQYLHVPLALKLAGMDKETGVQEGGLTLGYEFSILLSSKCNPPAGGLSVANRAMLERTKDMAKSSKLGGSIFLGGKVDLVAGCYLMGQLKFPITYFLALKDADQDGDDAKRALHGMRLLGASLVELGLGFNIMKWL